MVIQIQVTPETQADVVLLDYLPIERINFWTAEFLLQKSPAFINIIPISEKQLSTLTPECCGPNQAA
jgi:hypothetical protein